MCIIFESYTFIGAVHRSSSARSLRDRIQLGSFACTGSEARVTDCSYSSTVSPTQYCELAGVRCLTSTSGK